MRRIELCITLLALTGCFSSSRHVSTTRPDTVLPDKNLQVQYRLDKLTLTKPTVRADVDEMKLKSQHDEDTQKMLDVVRESLYKNYPGVFTPSPAAHSLSVHVGWRTRYQGDPVVQSFLSNMFVPQSAEQETIYSVMTRDATESWSVTSSGSRLSETWETTLLPIGFIPVPGKSDWSTTFCFMRLGKDSLVFNPSKQIDEVDCVRDLVFDPKVDGDVIAALIMRAVNLHRRDMLLDRLLKKGGAE